MAFLEFLIDILLQQFASVMMGHPHLGGIHGKIGLFVILLMALHLLKRWTRLH